MAQLEDASGGYSHSEHSVLERLLAEVPMKDGDEWMMELMKCDRMLGVFASATSTL